MKQESSTDRILSRDKLVSLLVLSNAFKEGDLPVGGTRDESVRAQARKELSALRLDDITRITLIDDQVTEAIRRSTDMALAKEISMLTVGELKEIFLGPECAFWLNKYKTGMQSECIAAVVKIMTNDELSRVSRTIFNPLPGPEKSGVLIGDAQHLGSRIQPNSPGDDPEEILMSILEGLAHGCGDVIIGLNPASDSVDRIVQLERILQSVVDALKLPTRFCVLSDMSKQAKAQQETKVDVGFQSLAGTSKGLVGMLGVDVDGICELAKCFDGLYFETGQGSAVTNRVAEGVDMVTLEARCYGLARYIWAQTGKKWMIVNDVAGFIGPEVFRTGEQLLRACLEDTLMAKLHGITMGLDVCSTFHMGIGPFELQSLTQRIVELAAPAYLMSVAGKADPMLGYMTTAFKEHPRLRLKNNKHIAGRMRDRLVELGVIGADETATGSAETVMDLYARYKAACGDLRDKTELREEGKAKLARLASAGFDIGYGYGPGAANPTVTDERLAKIYQNARAALTSEINPGVVTQCCHSPCAVETFARDREGYLSFPESGEQLNDKSADLLRYVFAAGEQPQVLFVISDGLNANAVNENIPALLPELRKRVQDAGLKVAGREVVIRNGRVRAGYHVGMCTGAELLVHFIGERPGTGLDQLSAYITYGNDPAGENRWSILMDHSLTTAICGIHAKGRPPAEAAEEIAACIQNAFKFRVTGVALVNFRQSS